MIDLKLFEKIFYEKMQMVLGHIDPAHDIFHVDRVVKNAKFLAEKEKANLYVVVPAAYLHDLVNLPKDHVDRQKASFYSAERAVEFLKEINYPQNYYAEIHHAIMSHSFSANITPETKEAKILQDADRLDALGAIGIYRLFTVGSQLNRNLNDTLKHIEEKLRVVSSSMHTNSAKIEATKRMSYIDNFIKELKQEDL